MQKMLMPCFSSAQLHPEAPNAPLHQGCSCCSPATAHLINHSCIYMWAEAFSPPPPSPNNACSSALRQLHWPEQLWDFSLLPVARLLEERGEQWLGFIVLPLTEGENKYQNTSRKAAVKDPSPSLALPESHSPLLPFPSVALALLSQLQRWRNRNLEVDPTRLNQKLTGKTVWRESNIKAISSSHDSEAVFLIDQTTRSLTLHQNYFFCFKPHFPPLHPDISHLSFPSRCLGLKFSVVITWMQPGFKFRQELFLFCIPTEEAALAE